jgi:hypothetical protein
MPLMYSRITIVLRGLPDIMLFRARIKNNSSPIGLTLPRIAPERRAWNRAVTRSQCAPGARLPISSYSRACCRVGSLCSRCYNNEREIPYSTWCICNPYIPFQYSTDLGYGVYVFRSQHTIHALKPGGAASRFIPCIKIMYTPY